MVQVSSRKCPICNFDEVNLLHEQKFILPNDHPLPDNYSVVCCRQCGFIYADTSTNQKTYDGYYVELSKSVDSKTSIGSGDEIWDARRLDHTALQIADRLSNPQARILDIGCAKGGLLSSLRKLGFRNLCGLDLTPLCVAETRKRGIQAEQGSLSQHPKQMGMFDCIILSHILEHVHDLRQAMQSIWLLTNTTGQIYIEVPDASRYIDQVSSPFQDFNVEHINHFSHTSLANLFQSTGFILVEEGTKEIEMGPSQLYPVIYSFWIKPADWNLNFKLVQDMRLEASILAYIQKSKATLRAIDLKIQSALSKSPDLIIWGTGQLVMKLLAETCLANAHIVAFVDGNPINQGRKYLNIPILAPDQIQTMLSPILVATILHQREIVEEIHQLGLPNEIILLDDSKRNKA